MLDGRLLPLAWVVVALCLIALTMAFVGQQARFEWHLALKDIPARALTLGLVTAGLVYAATLPLARATALMDDDLQRRLVRLVVLVGLGLRLALIPTVPALEDDQQRYLWEGALAAHGMSPYAIAPADGLAADRNTALGQLAEQAGPVLDRVNHPHLKTIYPPVAIGAFALAHRLSPFDLTAWRLVLLGADCLTLVLLLALLKDTGRAAIWVALYWWSPIALKEIMNSGHMDALLPPFVLGALLLTLRGRSISGIGAMSLAAGVKVWPVLLLPLLLRPMLADRRRLMCGMLVAGAIFAALAAPIVLGGLDQRSGFIAFAGEWQANSALLPALRDHIVAPITGLGTGPAGGAGWIARALLAGLAASVALALAIRPPRSADDLIQKAATVTLVLVLVSPAQFPWYMLWTLPFLPFAPRRGVVAMAALVPIYYVSFHFAAIGTYPVFRDRIVWLIWTPIWLILGLEALADRRRRAAPPVATR